MNSDQAVGGASRVGVDKIPVSNILPYSAEMEKEILCASTLSTGTSSSAAKTEIALPRTDVSPDTRETIFRLLRGYENLNLMGNPIFGSESLPVHRGTDVLCPLGWGGGPLHEPPHGCTTYLHEYERKISSSIPEAARRPRGVR